MSYKLDLSDLDRGATTSLTQQLVERFASAIDAGELAAGEQLPTTRRLAALAGVNHLTAARVYRQLAEAGYVTARVGAGTFVRALPPGAALDAEGDDWQALLLPEHRPSFALQALQESFRTPAEPGVISLATGWSDPALHPAAALSDLARDVFSDLGGEALNYLPAEGAATLRAELGRRGVGEGWAAGPEEIVVTSGAKQALDLIARAVLRPGDAVAVESPTFAGTLDSLGDCGARLLPVPVDEDGLNVDALERHLGRHEVKLVVLQPACQNPTGRDLSPARRRRLVALARERSFFVLEDAVYATTRFEGPELGRLRADAPSHVLYVDSLSKTIGGGLRIGWIAARGPVLGRLVGLKMTADVHTSSLSQHIAARWLGSGLHEEHLERTIPVYRERRDALLAALKRHLGAEVRVARPAGGHHVWVTLRRGVNERALYAEALREGVTFLPGSAALPDPAVASAMRLSFALATPDELREGVRRLGRALSRTRERALTAGSVPVS